MDTFVKEDFIPLSPESKLCPVSLRHKAEGRRVCPFYCLYEKQNPQSFEDGYAFSTDILLMKTLAIYTNAGQTMFFFKKFWQQ